MADVAVQPRNMLFYRIMNTTTRGFLEPWRGRWEDGTPLVGNPNGTQHQIWQYIVGQHDNFQLRNVVTHTSPASPVPANLGSVVVANRVAGVFRLNPVSHDVFRIRIVDLSLSWHLAPGWEMPVTLQGLAAGEQFWQFFLVPSHSVQGQAGVMDDVEAVEAEEAEVDEA